MLIAKTVAGTRLFIIDDEGVVYALGRQEIFALNTTATYLWCLIEEEQEQDTILRDFAATFGIAERTAAAQKTAALETENIRACLRRTCYFMSVFEVSGAVPYSPPCRC